MEKIGVLALQGSFAEHLQILGRIPGIEATAVKTIDELNAVDRLILPGGESTAIGKLLVKTGMFPVLRQRIGEGLPVWGTCAGLILLAHEIVGETPYLDVMNITVRRNAYGSQLDSFCCEQIIPAFGSDPLPLVFIRAPWIEKAGQEVEVLAGHDGRIIAAKQGRLLVTSFHPELTDDKKVYNYFLRL
ncbi:MAG: pyridoxal 5'-phosphate synthase glutaminase subunit PdxT [Acholeplasmataceae bacterium]|nr:pyridoxal 5'-phosphate synthase glutaminase subunit PdxT [Acidaminococcaceae bacterium]NLY84106.1 pyridoxal 5'-phosphate synthase glutaminase subunit PdxT [Acholeplasmataceae bacterium]